MGTCVRCSYCHRTGVLDAGQVMRIPVFTSLGKRKGNAQRRIPDADIIAMRDMAKRHSTEQVAAAHPHVSNSYVRRVLAGKVRGDVA